MRQFSAYLRAKEIDIDSCAKIDRALLEDYLTYKATDGGSGRSNSSAMYVLLLAENKSGKTLAIDAVYDSISVNGFMTDGLCDSRELADGECAAIEIMLLESSLEANKITSVSDIEEIEIGMEIKEEGSSIDEPVIHIVWN